MNLLMLTKFYPYGTGEAFIENEIKVLAEYYDNITIIACEVTAEDKDIRALPRNVKAYKVPAGSKKKDAIKGVTYLFSGDRYLRAEKKECNGVLSEAFLGYFESKSQRVYRYILKNHYLEDIIKESFVIYSYWFFMTARVGTLIAKLNKPAFMITRAHGYDLYEERNIIHYLPYRKLFLKSFDIVFPCSNNGKEHLKEGYLDCTENVMTSFLGTLDHGVGVGSSDGVFRVVSCSRIEKVKRISKIIEALQLLEFEKVQIEWTHIGGGSGFDQIQKEASEKLHNIKFKLLGNMRNTDVMKLYSEKPFDLLVNVSSSEGLPVSIMEAISFGIAAVGTDVGGTSEIVIDGITGKLIPAEFSKEELADVIMNFATAGDMAISRESCRKFWEEHFQALPNYRKMWEYVKNSYTK